MREESTRHQVIARLERERQILVAALDESVEKPERYAFLRVELDRNERRREHEDR